MPTDPLTPQPADGPGSVPGGGEDLSPDIVIAPVDDPGPVDDAGSPDEDDGAGSEEAGVPFDVLVRPDNT